MSLFDQVRRNIFSAQQDIAHLNLQLSSQQRIIKPHEDPGGASRVIRLQALLSANAGFANAVEYARSKLEQSDGVLAQMNATTIDIQALAIDMADSGSSAAMRLATSETVSQALKNLVHLANTQVGDQFLFAGADAARTPFVMDGNEVVFHGDETELLASIAQGQFMGITLNPTTAFGALSVEKKGTANLNPRLNFGAGSIDGHSVTAAGTTTTFTDSSLIGAGYTAADLIGREVYVYDGTNEGSHGTISGYVPATGTVTIAAGDAFPQAFDATSRYSISQGRNATALSTLNAGNGVQEGSIRITLAGPAQNLDVDLTDARTIMDVRERIEAASSRLKVSLNGTGNGLVVTDSNGTSITIASLNGVTTAEDLGINGTNAGGVITGTDTNPVVTEETLIADMSGAVTNPLSLGSIHVINGSRTADIDLSTAVTMGDVLDLINNAETSDDRSMELVATINAAGTGLNIRSRLSGGEFSISQINAGDQTPQELGILTMTGSTNISSLRHGKGLDFAPGTDFVITENNVDYDIDLSSATTLQDIVNTINAQTGGAVTASLNTVNGNKLRLSGTSITLRDGNSNVLEQLGLEIGQPVAATVDSDDVTSLKVNSLFSAITDLINGLTGNDGGAIQQAGQDIDEAFDQLLQGRARVGGRLERLTLTSTQLETQNTFVSEELSATQDIDLAEKLTELQLQQVALQATLMSASRILEVSLLSYI
ncbi:MAG: flagellin [Planctomycetota bacterium]